MAKTRLIDTFVKRVSPPESGQEIHWDSEVIGFGCRVTSGGAKSFIVNYRASGRERRLTIGSYPDWSVAAAREQAKKVKAEVDLGGDPMAERHEDRACRTVAELAEEFLTKYAAVHKRPTSVQEDKDLLKHILPKLGKIKLNALKARDIEKFHIGMKETPVRANRAFALLRKMLSQAITWKYIDENVAVGIKLFDEQPRNRFLSAEELARISAELANADNSPRSDFRQSANAIRLIMLTGARRGEVLGASWSQLDLDAGVWTKPSSHVKQKREHRVPLSQEAIDILKSIKSISEGPYVFPGRNTTQAQGSISRFWYGVCDRSKVEDCHIHDLRHTFASILVSSGLSLPIIGALLGHTEAKTTQRYSHLMDSPLREATARVGAAIAASAGTK